MVFLDYMASSRLASNQIAKRLGKSLVKKGPARSIAHRKAVACEPCCVCGSPDKTGEPISQAHHSRVLSPKTLGVRVSDYSCVPLCVIHHDALHAIGDELAFWAAAGVDPAEWVRGFLNKGQGYV